MNELFKRAIISGTVNMKLNDQRTSAYGNCPKCQKELIIDINQEGSYNNLVSCMHCKEIYKIEINDAASQSNKVAAKTPEGISVYYTVKSANEPNWNKFFTLVMEGLFDDIGEIEEFKGGIICRPDKNHINFPVIIISRKEEKICFQIFGFFEEKEAGNTIKQAVGEFSNRFSADLHPILFEHWGYNANKELILLDSRKLGNFSPQTSSGVKEKKSGKA